MRCLHHKLRGWGCFSPLIVLNKDACRELSGKPVIKERYILLYTLQEIKYGLKRADFYRDRMICQSPEI